MLQRVLAFLLILGLALPALAAPLHCAPPPTPVAAPAATMGHHGHHDSGGEAPAPAKFAPAPKDCIGCAALAAPAAPVGAARIAAAPRPVRPLTARLDGQRRAPDTPPPRLHA
ncbi:MAG: hypothetical protein KGL54_14535 [Sphingomonadales bacterium]|nr:hypothetical protein [Sphingomonadales bacterium]